MTEEDITKQAGINLSKDIMELIEKNCSKYKNVFLAVALPALCGALWRVIFHHEVETPRDDSMETAIDYLKSHVRYMENAHQAAVHRKDG